MVTRTTTSDSETASTFHLRRVRTPQTGKPGSELFRHSVEGFSESPQDTHALRLQRRGTDARGNVAEGRGDRSFQELCSLHNGS